MLRGVLEAQAPPRQTAAETIDKYGDRLANATLLDDRRSAIQGLRSLAKEYPASVASKSLRDLISTLTRAADDVDTAQIVLETLLALFHPSETSVSLAARALGRLKCYFLTTNNELSQRLPTTYLYGSRMSSHK